jgi:nitrite reductase/ring-hydroxylating ferredoxin subunit
VLQCWYTSSNFLNFQGITGECVPTAQCTGRRTPTPGLCRGPASIQCCSDNWGICTVGQSLGVCRDVANCDGVTTSGRCPGPAGIRCCTPTNVTTREPLYEFSKDLILCRLYGAEFAPTTGVYWPLVQNETKSPICYLSQTGIPIQVPDLPMAQNYTCKTRRFLAMRDDGDRYHSGVDLYAPAGISLTIIVILIL